MPCESKYGDHGKLSDKRQSGKDARPSPWRGSRATSLEDRDPGKAGAIDVARESTRSSRSRVVTKRKRTSGRTWSRDRRPEERIGSGLGNAASTSGESEISRLALVLTDAVGSGPSQSRRYANEKFILECDSEVKTLSVVEWLKKIDELAKVLRWNGTDKILFAVMRLKQLQKHDGLVK